MGLAWWADVPRLAMGSLGWAISIGDLAWRADVPHLAKGLFELSWCVSMSWPRLVGRRASLCDGDDVLLGGDVLYTRAFNARCLTIIGIRF